jgi:hypothetical protein
MSCRVALFPVDSVAIQQKVDTDNIAGFATAPNH